MNIKKNRQENWNGLKKLVVERLQESFDGVGAETEHQADPTDAMLLILSGIIESISRSRIEFTIGKRNPS